MSEQAPGPGGSLIVVPVLHGRLEFAVAARQALEATRPDCVAVELPETLARPVLCGVKRLPLLSVVHYRNASGEPAYLLIEPADAMIEAVRWAQEQDIALHLIDQDVEEYGRHHDPFPDAYAVKRIGHARYVAACQTHPEPPDAADAGRERVMAWHLRRLLTQHRRVLLVCGLAHAQRIEALVKSEGELSEPLRRVKREGVTLYHLAAESSREVISEPAYLSSAFEEARRQGAPALDSLDRLGEQLHLSQRARAAHLKNSGDEVSLQALSTLFRFARNYALVEGRLAPDLYQLLVAARGIDDNFAYEVWDLATSWPHQTDRPELPVIQLSLEDLDRHARYLRFHRTQKTRRHQLLRLVKRRAKEREPGEWKRAWQGEAICSHQPEDVVVESYGDFLKRKAKGILSAEHSRVEPFSASILDGVDVRETLRNWHERRLYVREHQVVRGEVGAVVVVFNEDSRPGGAYPWTMTWQGEHAQESDMAFYATPLGEKVVGPGISRCEYGGFLLTYPPGRMFHVFEDPFFDWAESKPERLLLAAIDYSQEKHVVYVGPRPFRTIFRSLAERFGRRLVYIPLGDLSPVTLKQLRFFHVLDGHPVRAYAKQYIW